MQVLVWLDSTGYCVLSFARASGVKTCCHLLGGVGSKLEEC